MMTFVSLDTYQAALKRAERAEADAAVLHTTILAMIQAGTFPAPLAAYEVALNADAGAQLLAEVERLRRVETLAEGLVEAVEGYKEQAGARWRGISHDQGMAAYVLDAAVEAMKREEKDGR